MPPDRTGASGRHGVRHGLAHDSAIGHATGRATYIDDFREPAGTLHAVPGLAPIARGRVDAMDLDAVKRAEGIVAVLTAEDIPGANDIGPGGIGDDPAIAHEEIRF